mmetsp:Transcript_110981/g.314065  ORF Transcript_110981/g.314065 Transcript_110981/m.314065 type:complete len:132 (-) Transcript_110981:299-694(-)
MSSCPGSSIGFVAPAWKTFEVHIHRPDGALLGIQTVRAGSLPVSRGLFITDVIDGGIVARWNQMNFGKAQVLPGDTIIRVNGKEGDESAIAEELRTREELHITVLPCQAIIDACESANYLRHASRSPYASA